jgi:Cu/Ag efflux protein CusF
MEAIYMNRLSINTIKAKLQFAFLALTCLAFLSTIVSAHGDEIHVIGVVSKISDTGISVTTKDGKIIEVGFGDKTTYLRMKEPIDKSAIKVGDRIVIHAVKVKENLVAHTVEIGAAQH